MNTPTPLALNPDGFQVIDVTTGETIDHSNHVILTWQFATQILAKYAPTDLYVIKAVTEADVLRDCDLSYVDYEPQFFSFSLGTTRYGPKDGPYPTIAHSLHPDSAENETCPNPRLTKALLTMLGLPVAPTSDTQQKSWPIDLVHSRMKAFDAAHLGGDADLTQAYEDLAKLVGEAKDLPDVDLLLLENNSVQHP